MISSIESLLVTLHRPPPDIANFLPNFSPLSTNNTWAPFSPAAMAAIKPEGPPPITTTSYFKLITPLFFSVSSLYSNTLLECEQQ